MTDGIHIIYILPEFTIWKTKVEAKNVGIEFTIPTNTDTGAITGKTYKCNTTYTHRAKFGTYELRVLQTTKPTGTTYLLKIYGSLHKNYFGGANFERFTYQQMQQEIKNLCSTLEIEPRAARITNLEIGVNIPLPFAVSPFIHNSLLIHKTTEYIPYDKKDGISLGLTAAHRQYSIKGYDKGLQNNLPDPLFRFEIRYLKMQSLNKKGIYTLSDLQQPEKVRALKNVLVKSWNETLLDEPELDINTLPLSNTERELILTGRNRTEWTKLLYQNPRRFKERRRQFKNLLQQYGKNTHAQILTLLKTEWQKLWIDCPNLPFAENSTDPIKQGIEDKGMYFFTIKVKGNIGHNEKRHCQTCGCDITNQKPNSKFCSAKIVGYQHARRCRNRESNPRNFRLRKYGLQDGQGYLF